MKFKLSQTDLYWWPVTVRVPDRRFPGKIVKQRFDMQFQPLGREEALAQEERAEACVTAREKVEVEIENLLRVVKGWNESVVDDDDKPVPFTEETFRLALQKSWFRIGVLEAYAESLHGDEARLGN